MTNELQTELDWLERFIAGRFTWHAQRSISHFIDSGKPFSNATLDNIMDFSKRDAKEIKVIVMTIINRVLKGELK